MPDALQGIVAQAADHVPLFQDVQSFGELPSEDELIAHSSCRSCARSAGRRSGSR